MFEAQIEEMYADDGAAPAKVATTTIDTTKQKINA